MVTGMKGYEKRPGMRALAVELLKSGKGPRDVASILGVGPSLIDYYRRQAGLPNAPARLSREELIASLAPPLQERVVLFLADQP